MSDTLSQSKCEWKEYKLEDFAKINPSESIPKGTIAKKIPMEIIQPFTKRIPAYSNEEYKGGVKFRNGDTLMARITPSLENGKTSYVDILEEDEVGFGSTEFIVLREKEKISDKHFIYYLAISPTIRFTAIKSMTGSSGRQRVQTDVVKEHVFEAPELTEQRAIASVLSSLDDKIDLLHRQNQTLEQMAETLFRQWFVEEADEGWEEIEIESLFEVRDGTHDSPKKQDYGKKLITSRHLKPNFIDLDNAYYISEEDYNAVNKRSRVDKGDILFSMIGTIGIIFLEDSNNIDYAIKNIGLFKTSQNPRWSYFTYLWLKSALGDKFIHETRSGSTQEYISLGNLRSIVFLVRSERQLDDFNSIVEEYFLKIKSNQSQISTLTALRDTLLPKLMSGEVKVKT